MDRDSLVTLLTQEIVHSGSMSNTKVPVFEVNPGIDRCSRSLQSMLSRPNRHDRPIQLQSSALPPMF